jgi:predicted RNase H-like HicB family nuclease
MGTEDGRGGPSTAQARAPELITLAPQALGSHPDLMKLTAAVTKEGDLYVAQCLEVDVASQGATFEEAMANLQEALELRFEGDDAPEVRPSPIVAPIVIRAAS